MILLTTLKYIALIAIILILIVIIVIIVLFWDKGQLVYAEDKNGVPYIQIDKSNVKISTLQAIVLAKPYLLQSLEQIKKIVGAAMAHGVEETILF